MHRRRLILCKYPEEFTEGGEANFFIAIIKNNIFFFFTFLPLSILSAKIYRSNRPLHPLPDAHEKIADMSVPYLIFALFFASL